MYSKASADLQRVLKLEPHNKTAQKLFQKISATPNIVLDSGGDNNKQNQIEDIHYAETCKSMPKNLKLASFNTEDQSKQTSPLSFLDFIQQLKDEGNCLFKTGQFCSAAKKYTNAIQFLKEGKK